MNDRRPSRTTRSSKRLSRTSPGEDAETTAPSTSSLSVGDDDENPTEVHDPRVGAAALASEIFGELDPPTQESDPFRPSARAGRTSLSAAAVARVQEEEPPPPLPPPPPPPRGRPRSSTALPPPLPPPPKPRARASQTLPPPLPEPPPAPRRPLARRTKSRPGAEGFGPDDFTSAELLAGPPAARISVSVPSSDIPVVRLQAHTPRRGSEDTGVPDRRDQSEVTSQIRLPGLIDGRYQISAPLGEGGMGRVLKVLHRALNKEFALKIVRAQLSDDWRAREAFFREARMLSSLGHPNIVTVTDFGVDPAFGAFIVMEFLTGETLLQRITREGRLSLKAACDIALQIGEAVRFIHSNNIIHCDLKSENVFLCQPVAEPRRRNMVKLMDFGLSRSWEGGTDRTREKEIAGTPTYLAPERIEGRPPAPSNDIYALGVLFYEMITGRPPFMGSINKVLDAHLDEMPLPPSKRLGEHLEERADELIMKALAKDPRRRQRDAAAFVYEVRTLMDMLGIKHKRRILTPGRAPSAAEYAGSAESRLHLYEDAYDGSPLPLVTLAPGGEVKLANRALARLLALTPAELGGLSLRTTLIGQQNPQVLDDFRTVVATGRSAQCQVEFMREGKRQRAVLLLVPAHDGQAVVAVHGVLYPVAMSRPPQSR
jgi:tRNA A-37 threonylcarbamoyl transferase component Bud32